MSGSSVGKTVVWPHYSKDNAVLAKQNNNGSLGKDDFLKILVTQLKNQDPMQPLQDKEFIAQMAQFTSMEQIMNMASEMKQLRQSMGIASGLIGKQVSWMETKQTGTVTKTGIVSAITNKDGIQHVVVDGQEIPLDDLVKVSNPEEQ